MSGTSKRIKFPPKSVMSPPLFRSHLHESSAAQTAGEHSALGMCRARAVTMTTCVQRHQRGGLACLRVVLLSERLTVLCFLLMFLLILAAAVLALARAGFLLTLGKGLQPVQELCFPGLEVGLHAAVSALCYVAVAFSSGHDPGSTQHPQPLIYVLTDLDTESIFSVRFNTVPSKMK